MVVARCVGVSKAPTVQTPKQPLALGHPKGYYKCPWGVKGHCVLGATRDSPGDHKCHIGNSRAI